MKTAIKNLQCITMCTLLLFAVGCSKDENEPDPGDGQIEEVNGIAAEDLDNYGGDLGLLINTRALVKKGYIPTKVNITTTAAQGNYNQELDVDSFTNIAQLKLAVDDLSESAVEELRNGVGLTIEIIDASNTVLSSESYSVISFEENGNEFDIDASSLDYTSESIYFKEGMRHYLQISNSDGTYGSTIANKTGSGSLDNSWIMSKESSFNPGTTSEQFYIYKFPNEENTFSIYSAITGRYLGIDPGDKVLKHSGGVSYPSGLIDNSLNPIYKFKIIRADNGLYTLNDIDGNPLRRFGSNWRATGSNIVEHWKFIALDIDWETTELSTKHLQPILPKVNTSFGFNSTLRNCGSGSLEQQVGVESSVTTTFTSAFQETIGLSGRTTTSVEVGVSATAEASYFGVSGSVTAEVSAGLEVSVEASTESTESVEESVSDTNTFFSNRTVTVPSGSASLVYDAYQTFSDVKVPYVKRLRLKGLHTSSSEFLTGQEIATQLAMANFSGVVTNIGSDFAEITIRGNITLDNIVDTQTEVRDVAANCN